MEIDYKTLEQQIISLWKSRGMKVGSIKVEPLSGNDMKWIIVADVGGK